MKLSDLQKGETAVLLKVMGHGSFRKRVMEMGFVQGKVVSVVMNAPLRDPIVYKIMDYEVSLRRSEAAMIEVITQQEALTMIGERAFNDVMESDQQIEQLIVSPHKNINIALVGNPNCGKTSLFNSLCGSSEHVGNYSGVTVDAKRGTFKYGGYAFTVYDLPGTYSLASYSPEEKYVRKHITESMPDVIVNVVAASNLQRNLYLTTELIDTDSRMVIALNMYDELERSGAKLDHGVLGAMIGVPIVPTVSRSGQGKEELLNRIIQIHEGTDPTVRHIHINYGTELESAITEIRNQLRDDVGVPKNFSTRYLAIKLLEGDTEIQKMLETHSDYDRLIGVRDEQVRRVTRALGEDMETAVANEKYGFITGALAETYTVGGIEQASTTKIIDSFVTHKLFGFPIFIFLMWLMFEATFSLGTYPMEWIEAGVGALGVLVRSTMADGTLKDLIIDGVLGGVGGVIVFLPNIMILYLFISFMEDSGYMARAAFIMDKLMHRIGLHGKSFIPLIMGFGCNVPAIMSARTIESHSSRIITVLINPFISCSARLPIYILLVGVFFPAYSSLVMLGLYLLGIVVAVLTAKLLRKFLFKEDETPFVMELPPYRMPTAMSAVRHMWDKAWQYLQKMGGIILIASIVVWFLSYYPRVEGGNDDATAKMEQQKESYLGQFGQFCQPVVAPLGFNWKVTIALLTGTAAKELVVSTLGVLYADDDPEGGATLKKQLVAVNPETGTPDFTPASALAFMVFVLLYFPCIAAVVAVGKETGSWRWSVFTIVYNTLVAWAFAWATFNIYGLFG